MDKTIKEMTKQELEQLRTQVVDACKSSPEGSQERIASKVVLTEIDERLQEIAHDSGEPCDEEWCQDCCGEFVGHEHDSSEGGYCLQCGHHPHD